MSALGTLAPSADAELFADTLSCQLQLPAGFRAGSDAGAHSAAETLLRSLCQGEDLR
ncbi:PilZ domain-containing protein, partial [Xanthomonas perforans]